VEEGKHENPEKNPWTCKTELVYDTESRDWTWDHRGERWAISLPCDPCFPNTFSILETAAKP
jgi:hypothetical protein